LQLDSYLSVLKVREDAYQQRSHSRRRKDMTYASEPYARARGMIATNFRPCTTGMN